MHSNKEFNTETLEECIDTDKTPPLDYPICGFDGNLCEVSISVPDRIRRQHTFRSRLRDSQHWELCCQQF